MLIIDRGSSSFGLTSALIKDPIKSICQQIISIAKVIIQ
jgi:hypothetical protein